MSKLGMSSWTEERLREMMREEIALFVDVTGTPIFNEGHNDIVIHRQAYLGWLKGVGLDKSTPPATKPDLEGQDETEGE